MKKVPRRWKRMKTERERERSTVELPKIWTLLTKKSWMVFFAAATLQRLLLTQRGFLASWWCTNYCEYHRRWCCLCGRHLIDRISDWPNPRGFTKGVRFVCLNKYVQVDQKPFGQSKIRSIRVLRSLHGHSRWPSFCFVVISMLFNWLKTVEQIMDWLDSNCGILVAKSQQYNRTENKPLIEK